MPVLNYPDSIAGTLFDDGEGNIFIMILKSIRVENRILEVNVSVGRAGDRNPTIETSLETESGFIDERIDKWPQISLNENNIDLNNMDSIKLSGVTEGGERIASIGARTETSPFASDELIFEWGEKSSNLVPVLISATAGVALGYIASKGQ